MKIVFWSSFLCALLTVSVARSEVKTDSPRFSIDNATSLPVRVEVKDSSNALKINGILQARQQFVRH